MGFRAMVLASVLASSGPSVAARAKPIHATPGKRYTESMRPHALLTPTPAGLHCPPADIYIDPVRPVARALITHGHADHARAGHGAVLATAETLMIMAARYGEGFTQDRQVARLGETVHHNGVAFTFHPAGHVLGSAQIAVEKDGLRIVVSGDYKRQPDLTCQPFEPVACDVFITEATFGLPVFRHPDTGGEVGKLLASLALFPERAHIVGAYALGKAQRLVALIRAAGHDRPIYVHGAMEKLMALYADCGVPLGEIRKVAAADRRKLKGEIVICPPSAVQDLWARQFPDPVTAFASGWMRIRARARQKGCELPLIVSDHADWDDLQRTILEVAAPEVWVTHGQEDALVHWCGAQGVAARPLRLAGYGDDGEAEPEPAA
jgi:putative mRNA 3-end processing factor